MEYAPAVSGEESSPLSYVLNSNDLWSFLVYSH